MTDILSVLQQQLINWAEHAAELNWLDDRSVELLKNARTTTPGSLFDSPERPLVVGLFGGTGVGKSTLLNRLAGDNVAQTGVERPTSRDITVYSHQSVAVDHLPAEFPMQRMRNAVHQNERYRSVLWIDMPDFDSVEEKHRELVELWLPHIDVVIYVVSPDRYRDDQGWRLLLQHGTQHAWLFVINHWDRGDQRQLVDFQALLSKAGLSNPMIFCTDSRTIATQSDPMNTAVNSAEQVNFDDFNKLAHTIQTIAGEKLVQQLESRGVMQRVKQLQQIAEILRRRMGTESALDELSSSWGVHWQQTADQLTENSAWKIPLLAENYADHSVSWFGQIVGKLFGKHEKTLGPNSTATMPTDAQAVLPQLIDDSFFDRCQDAIDLFTQKGRNQGVPLQALNAHFNARRDTLFDRLPALVQDSVHQSLAIPGTRAQRYLHRALIYLAGLLPLGAMLWVGFRVVNAFWLGGVEPSAYLGSDFAVNSALLLGLAWLAPTFLARKVQPSRQSAASRGLQAGLQLALQTTHDELQQAIHLAVAERHQLDSELTAQLASPDTFNDAVLPDVVRRMLIADATPA